MGTYDEIKQAADLKEYCEGNLERRGRDEYVCPACGSGNGPNRTAALHVWANEGRWRCFSCNRGGDIFDLAGIVNGTEDKREQLSLVAAWFGLEDGARGREGRSKTTAQATTGNRPDRIIEDHTEGRAASRAYIERARANINDPEAVAYLEARGFTLEDARRFGLGYDPTAGGAQDGSGNWCRRGRIVIPWHGSDYYHIDRSIDPTASKHKYDKPDAQDVGAQPLWNRNVIGSGRPYFVVEGALDALAIEAVGGEAVALGGTATETYLQEAAAHARETLPILLLDKDDRGKEAEDKLADSLEARGIAYRKASYRIRSTDGAAGPKDAADVLAMETARTDDGNVSGREALRHFVISSNDLARRDADARREAAYVAALKHLRVFDPANVAGDILVLKEPRGTIPTRIASLDIALDGGLPSRGLVTLGAVSSMGKTTLLTQIADNMARDGRSVLFVTIEQAADEIVAKSLSRLMAERTREDGSKVKASAQHILDGRQRRRWYESDPEKAGALQAACETYASTIAPNLRIMEADGRPSVADVRAVAETMAAHDGRTPVILIDYLQLLAPQDERQTDKQATDANMTALRQLAKVLGTCVFVLSSLNRTSYTGSITLASFKESGSIEYTSDLLLGLQPQGMASDLEGLGESKKNDEASRLSHDFKQATDRDAEIVILKNRNGGVVLDGVALKYDAVTNTFAEGRPQAQTKTRRRTI